MAKYTDKQALDELKRSIDEIDNVRKKPRLSPKFKAWQIETSELLDDLFGRDSKQVKEFDRIPYSLAAFSNQTPDSKFDEAFQQGLKTAAITLSSAVKEIQTNGVGGKSKQSNAAASSPKEPVEETKTAPVPPPDPPPSSSSKISTEKESEDKPVTVRRVLSSTDSNKVLIISSGEKTVSADVREFLSKIGLSPVLKDFKVDQHDRIFSVIEQNPDTEYAIVLLGFDSTKNGNDYAYGMGVLVGRLGQDRVCAVVNDKMTGIDTYSGINYVPVDAAGAWKFMMIKNLKASGFDVDANLAL